MTALLRTPVTPVWFILVAATIVSYVLGADYGPGNHHAATVVVMSVAFVKTWFVGMYFMELRAAPPALRYAFQLWVGGFLAMIVLVYLLA